jgi:hypothetical protein
MMEMHHLGDRVVYQGQNADRLGQEADIVAFGAGDFVDIEFDEVDATGDKKITTTIDNIKGVGVRLPMWSQPYVSQSTVPLWGGLDDDRLTEPMPIRR